MNKRLFDPNGIKCSNCGDWMLWYDKSTAPRWMCGHCGEILFEDEIDQ